PRLDGLRRAVLRRPALHGVRDEEVAAVEPRAFEHVVEVAPGRADEGLARLVLVLARSLADDHHARSVLAVTRYSVCTRLVQRAARADPYLRGQLVQSPRFFGLRHHTSLLEPVSRNQACNLHAKNPRRSRTSERLRTQMNFSELAQTYERISQAGSD